MQFYAQECSIKESDHDQEQTSVHVAEWAWQEEYDKVWKIQLQGIYYTTRLEKDDAIAQVKVLRASC